MIVGVTWIDHCCTPEREHPPRETCGQPAVVQVTRTNDDLPSTYIRSGTRVIYYCLKHIPDDARSFWNGAFDVGGVADSPIVKRDTL